SWTPEFSRRVPVDQLRRGKNPRHVRITAGEEEREAVRRRLDLLSLDSLGGEFHITSADDDTLVAAGQMTARFSQRCVVTLAAVPGAIDRALRLRFSPQNRPGRDPRLEGDDDGLFYGAAGPDLGEALTQELALSLPPWPRAEGARLPQTAWGEEDETPPAAPPSPPENDAKPPLSGASAAPLARADD
ncbi:MAG: DUF177 domain-containing protein, partial [Alphaproteobacteria bacterium]|nr:DUF177 domain-containing protein [Alphaproteobacteria bacterium]MDA8030889.1 DUF177 domain-containing protein [Alphaproteobacteria bacterium]